MVRYPGIVGRLLLYCGCVVLAACQSAGSRDGFYSSPLQPGDQVEVRKELPVPAGKARVYLQDGRITTYGGTDQYAPFCYFLLRDPLPTGQVIKPGVFDVDSVSLNEASVSLEFPQQLAWSVGIGGGFDRMPIAHQFHIRLKSMEQSNVTLVCSGAFAPPIEAAPIRLPEVRQALGEYAAVRVRGVPAGR